MLWQNQSASTSTQADEKPHQPAEPKTPVPDDYDVQLDKLMVSEGCPNCRDDD